MSQYPRLTKQPKDNLSIQDVKPPTISNCCALSVLLLGTFLICAIIILNVFIDTPLFILGVNFIYDMQHHIPHGWVVVIQNIISLLCEVFVIGGILVIYYIVVKRKLLLLVHLSYFLFAIYIIALLKQAFQQSRPIWYDERIQAWYWVCNKDFGNPSGHSFAVILLYEPIISDSIGYWKYKPWSWVLIFFCITIPLSRLYLGSHSVNQVLFGLSLGNVFLILYKYIYQRALYDLFWQFLLGRAKAIKFLGIILLNLIVIIIPIVFYEINTRERPMIEKDITNLNKRCGSSLTGMRVQAQMMDACCIGCFAFGLIYGFMLLSNKPGYRKYLLGLWGYESFFKMFLKIGVYIACAGIPFIFFYIFAHFLVKQPHFHYILYCLGITGAGMGLSYLAPIVTSHCKIMKLLPGSAEDYQQQLDQIHQ